MKIPSFAKINLGLEVLRRRPDGYHDIRTLYQWISLRDTIEIRPIAAPEIRLSGSDPSIAWDDSNLVHRAARLLREKAGVRTGVEIEVTKRVPAGGGLGGGSSNAAMTLWGLDALWGLGLEQRELEDLGRSLGMDVPYFFTGGLCLGEDRGDRLRPLPDLPRYPVVLAFPPFPVPTSLVYRSLDPAALTSEAQEDKMTRFLRTWELGSLTNTLEETIFRLFPELREIRNLLIAQGAALSLVTGSGSTVAGLFEDRKRAEIGRAALAGRVETALVETLGRAEGWEAITAGASPSGKAAGFGPAIGGSNPPAPESDRTAPGARDKGQRS